MYPLGGTGRAKATRRPAEYCGALRLKGLSRSNRRLVLVLGDYPAIRRRTILSVAQKLVADHPARHRPFLATCEGLSLPLAYLRANRRRTKLRAEGFRVNSAAWLENLPAANLSVVSLDAERRWPHYHSCFAHLSHCARQMTTDAIEQHDRAGRVPPLAARPVVGMVPWQTTRNAAGVAGLGDGAPLSCGGFDFGQPAPPGGPEIVQVSRRSRHCL